MTAGALTWEEFARLRTEANRRALEAGYGRRFTTDQWGDDWTAPGLLAPIDRVTAPAGWWVRPCSSSASAVRWHVFTGDLLWSPAWTHVAPGILCRPPIGGGSAEFAERPPDGEACRNCLARLGSA